MEEQSNNENDWILVKNKKIKNKPFEQNVNNEKDQNYVIMGKNSSKKTFECTTIQKNKNPNKQNKQKDNESKIGRLEEAQIIKKIPLEISYRIRDARMKNKMTQKELSVKINEKPVIVSDYESGKAIPNQQVLIKLEKVLGVKLRG